jgi:hypothetical protein
MATLNVNTWGQAKQYVANFLKTSDISGNGDLELPVPTSGDEFVPMAEVLFKQIIQKHGGDAGAYHGHTGTAGGLIALIDAVRENGNPELAKQLATSIYNNGSGTGYVMTQSRGRVEFKGTSPCTRHDLSAYAKGTGVFAGLWAGRQD